MLVNKLLIISHQTFRNSLPNSINLSDPTTAGNFNFNVDAFEPVFADDEHWLLEFESEAFGLDFVEGSAVDFDEAGAFFGDGDGRGGLFAAVDLDVITGGGSHFLVFVVF